LIVYTRPVDDPVKLNVKSAPLQTELNEETVVPAVGAPVQEGCKGLLYNLQHQNNHMFHKVQRGFRLHSG